jgi:leucine dehydrogenase
MSVFTHGSFDRHELVAFRCDPHSGLRAIIAVHDTRLGPALGGCRIHPYADEEAALADVLRLSRGMTLKSALAGLPLGGGKSVIIADPARDKTRALLLAMGEFIDSLGGCYIGAEDAGSSVADMAVMAERTCHVAGLPSEQFGSGDPSPATAHGVFTGIRAALAHRFGTPDPRGIRVAILGVGNVGERLARLLHMAGARLFVADVDERRVARVCDETGARPLSVEGFWGADVDVLSPCALGGGLNPVTVPRIRAAIVAGSANNQLASEAMGDLLRERGVLYAPDFAINAGGVIAIHYQRSGGSWGAAMQHVERIGDTLSELFVRAEREQCSTALLAERLACERLGRPPQPDGVERAA